MHEGIPILDYLVPKAFVHDGGRLTGMTLREGARRVRREGPAQAACRPASPMTFHACDDVLVAVGQENAFPWIERDIGIDFDEWGMPVVDATTLQSTRCRTCSSAATPRSGRRTSSGRSRTATTRRSRSTCSCHGEDAARAAATDGAPRLAEDGHPRVELRQRRVARRRRYACRSRTRRSRSTSISIEVELGFDPATRVRGSAALPQLRRADGVRRQAVHRMRRLRRHLPDGLHHVHRQRRRSRTCARG